MKYNIYDANKAQRDENNSPIKFGYYTHNNTNAKLKKLIDSMAEYVYEDKFSTDDGRICLPAIINQIKDGDHVYIGSEDAFSSNRQLHFAYRKIIALMGGEVYDLSNDYDLKRLTEQGA